MYWNSPRLRDGSLLFLRLIIGAIFLYVGGYGKLFIWYTPPEGMTPGMVLLMKFLSIVEPIGGAAVIAGFLTRWAATGLGIIMVGAVFFLRFMMHAAWFTGQAGPGIDYVLLILAGCLVLMAVGAGPWSVDATRKKARG